MNPLSELFFETVEGEKLYHDSVELYEKIEREHAHTVDVNGITMGYLEFGSSDGVPLIWAHATGITGYEIVVVKPTAFRHGASIHSCLAAKPGAWWVGRLS